MTDHELNAVRDAPGSSDQDDKMVRIRYGDLMTLCAHAVVLVSIYEQYAKPGRRRGPDPFFKTRLKDFIRGSELAQKVAYNAKTRI